MNLLVGLNFCYVNFSPKHQPWRRQTLGIARKQKPHQISRTGSRLKDTGAARSPPCLNCTIVCCCPISPTALSPQNRMTGFLELVLVVVNSALYVQARHKCITKVESARQAPPTTPTRRTKDSPKRGAYAMAIHAPTINLQNWPSRIIKNGICLDLKSLR